MRYASASTTPWGGTARVNVKYYAGNPVAQAQVMRGIYEMAGPMSGTSISRVMGADDVKSNEWRYLAYASVSLAEVCQPLVTLEGIDGE